MKFLSTIILPVIIGSLLISSGYIIISQNPIREDKDGFKCLKCHKGSKSLENIAKEKNITSSKELRYLIREGPKKGLHTTVPDEDLEKAIQYLNLP